MKAIPTFLLAIALLFATVSCFSAGEENYRIITEAFDEMMNNKSNPQAYKDELLKFHKLGQIVLKIKISYAFDKYVEPRYWQ